MRKYILFTLLLSTTAVLFIALHKYVEVSVLAAAQAQTKGTSDAEANNHGDKGAEVCDKQCQENKMRNQNDRYYMARSGSDTAALTACYLSPNSCTKAEMQKLEREANQ